MKTTALLGCLGTAGVLLLVAAGCSTSGSDGLLSGRDATGVDGLSDGSAASDSGGTADSPTFPDVPGCEGCFAPAVCIDGFCVPPAPGGCTPGATSACSGKSAIFTCDPTGTARVPVTCPNNQSCFDGSCTPVICIPGESICQGLEAKKACNAEGTGFEATVACPQGNYCTSGKCTDACFADPKFGAYVGCAYWTVDLPNWPDPTIFPTNPEDLPHALVISNPNEVAAEITFEPPPGVTMNLTTAIIPGGQSKVILMPVLNTEGTGVAHKGIYFSSNRPILAHQFNPWKAIWSNDASLLFPESFLGSEYVIHSWPTDPRGLLPIPGFPPMPNVNSFFTVVAPHDDTEVTFRVSARIAAGPKVAAMENGDVQTVTLQRGEVLNVEGEPLSIFESADLTGSTVSATKPIAVFAGHESASIANPNAPAEEDSCCLDHLEEQMLPISVLDTDYLAVKSKPRGNDPDLWRIVAAEPNVTLHTLPPQPGANGVTLVHKGDWVQVVTADSFEIKASGKIQVGQYFIGGSATTQGTGDPSLMLAVPSQRFREFYVLTVPPGYDTNWLTIIRPAGATITSKNGLVPDSAFQAFGSGMWERAYLELPAGVHTLSGDQPFGLIAYGYNGAMSYGYSGGMN